MPAVTAWLHFGAHEEEGLEATHDTFRKIGLEGVARVGNNLE